MYAVICKTASQTMALYNKIRSTLDSLKAFS